MREDAKESHLNYLKKKIVKDLRKSFSQQEQFNDFDL